ncbi:MAG: DUF5618 family protein [Bacteroidales bacterium]|nr:DUF5618 family protein [Bacteroidales bacterium]
MELENPIEEARRYVANAEEIIKNSKLDPETNLYRDKKYVRIAGDTLWKGCLIALDAVLGVRKGKGRPSIAKYQEAAAKRDRKLLQFVNTGYETLHLHMGYDGNKGKKVCDAGFDYANAIINCCELLYPNNPSPQVA